jgi:chorismate mutase
MKSNKLVVLTTMLLLSTSAFAQNSVNNRRKNQQDRIANGTQSGALTAGETKSLESKEANLNREVHADRSANGGKLTPQEHGQVERQENGLSKQIYNDKHNGNTAHYGNGEVGQRRQAQQDRIANGMRNGSLRPGEAANLENREQGINQKINADRQANGGSLTPGQAKQVNRAQNKASKAIYQDKHNAKQGY